MTRSHRTRERGARAAGLLALAVVAACAGPRVAYDPSLNALVRSDGAFELPLAVRDLARWQAEIPGERGAPKRFDFAYDALLYRHRSGRPGTPPVAIVVLNARPFPERVRTETSLTARSALLFETMKRWLREQGFGALTEDDDRFFFDGHALTVSLLDLERPLEEPSMGAAFLFGTEFVLLAVYEVYPASEEEPMSAKELKEILGEVARLLAGALVR